MSLFLLLLSLSITALAFEDPFDCHFQANGLKYDIEALNGEHTVSRERDTPPTHEIHSVTFSLCSDLKHQEGIPDVDQCPLGTRVCLTKINRKDGDSDRIVSVIPIAQTSELDPSYDRLSSPKGVSIFLHGSLYPHPINTTDAEQSVNITLLCDTNLGKPEFVSYDGARLVLEWAAPAGCGFEGEGEKDGGESPGKGESGSGSLSSMGWFLLLRSQRTWASAHTTTIRRMGPAASI